MTPCLLGFESSSHDDLSIIPSSRRAFLISCFLMMIFGVLNSFEDIVSYYLLHMNYKQIVLLN